MRKAGMIFFWMAVLSAVSLCAGTEERPGLLLFADTGVSFGVAGEPFHDRPGPSFSLAGQARLWGNTYAEILADMGSGGGVQINLVPKWRPRRIVRPFMKLGLALGEFGGVAFGGLLAGAGVERRLGYHLLLRFGGALLLGLDDEAFFAAWGRLSAGLGIRIK